MKYEILNPKQIRISNDQKTFKPISNFGFLTLNLFGISKLGFRISQWN